MMRYDIIFGMSCPIRRQSSSNMTVMAATAVRSQSDYVKPPKLTRHSIARVSTDGLHRLQATDDRLRGGRLSFRPCACIYPARRQEAGSILAAMTDARSR
jgi:hypothetical protein